MKLRMAIITVTVVLISAFCDASEPVIPKRIDGGILVPTTDAVKRLIEACVPIKIVVSFVILEDGTAAELNVVEAVPDGVDVSIAVDAVKQFQYEPILVDGVAVKSTIQTQATTYNPADDPNCSDNDDIDAPPNKSLEQPGHE